MKIDEFIERVAGETEQSVLESVSTPPPEVLAKAASPGGLLMTELLSVVPLRTEQRVFRYRHVLGDPASQEAIDTWRSEHPLHVLPQDLQALVARINGVHLWADAETGRSYTGLAPIDEWDVARVKMYGPLADRSLLDDRYVALSYHADGAAYVVLDAHSGRYFLMDVAGPDTTSLVGHDAEEVLDWLWTHRMSPTS